MILEHQQTVDTHARAPQVTSGLTWCPSINYYRQIIISKLHQSFVTGIEKIETIISVNF